MARIDNAEAIRDRAYAIWEREGRPSGREHEHWAEAARDVENPEVAVAQLEPIVEAETQETPSQEMDRLRRALYEPIEFAEELSPDGPFMTEPANDAAAAQKSGRRAKR